MSLSNQHQEGSQRVKSNFNNQKLVQIIRLIINGKVISNVQNIRDGCAGSNNTMPCDLVTTIPPKVDLSCCKKAG